MADERAPGQHCLNCDAVISGQYCGQCGQRAAGRLISLWELIRDAFGDLFEMDSRLWRTLIPLLIRPGRLTVEYLQGRRVRYMPPFRMYLVLSLVFFLVAFFDPHQSFSILFEADPEPAAVELSEEDIGRRQAGREEAREAVAELVREGLIDESLVGPGGLIELDTGNTSAADSEQVTPDAPQPPAADDAPANQDLRRDEPDNFVVSFDDPGFDINCDEGKFSVGSAPVWLQRRLTEERLRHMCERGKAVGTAGILSAMLDNVPAALLILLPLLALMLKLLYPLARRYYVEHLLFLVHFHSFIFLLLTVLVLWARVAGWWTWPSAVTVLPATAGGFYVPAYLFMALRRVYGQGRFVTFLKFSAMTIIYLVSFTFIMLGAFLLAAFSL